VRMEEFSRRLWSPARQGAQRETKWFYERARGQYADAQAKLTPAEQKRFQGEYPKDQMFTKTDLAKYDNVWDGFPVPVNQGAQKNFAHYAGRIGQEWDKNADRFNQFYFKRAVARGIIFRKTEKLVSAQSWYNGGYRANIVAYTIAMLARICSLRKQSFNFINVWNRQEISPTTVQAIEITAQLVHDDIMNPIGNISNISEWCKREACWQHLQTKTDRLIAMLPDKFFDELVSEDDVEDESRSAVKTQRLQNGILAQKAVLEIPVEAWTHILTVGQKKRLFSPKELSILQVAVQIPVKIPTEKQCFVLLDILEKAKLEAIYQE
jgi:hypothetical protein